MTVKELISQLEDCDPNLPVYFAYNYGDHWNTEVADSPREVDQGTVLHSDYHRRMRVVDPDDSDCGRGEPVKAIIIR